MKDALIIKTILETKAVTNSMFAKNIGVHRSLITNLIAGRQSITKTVAKNIIKCYNDINYSFLVGESDNVLLFDEKDIQNNVNLFSPREDTDIEKILKNQIEIKAMMKKILKKLGD